MKKNNSKVMLRRMRALMMVAAAIIMICAASADARIYEYTTTHQGELASLADPDFASIDSIRVKGPLNFDDIATLKGYVKDHRLIYIDIEDCSLPDNTLPQEAFYENNSTTLNLHEIILPSSLRTISRFAFDNTNLERVKFPSDLTKMEVGCFASCPLLDMSRIEFPEGIDTIPASCFYASGIPGSVLTIPSHIKVIEIEAFSYATFSGFIFNEGLETIGNLVFMNMDNLGDEMKFPNSLKAIGDKATYNNDQLRKVEFGSELEYIGPNAFSYKNKPFEVTFKPVKNLIIDSNSFIGSNISDISLPEGTTAIGHLAFFNCNPETISLPSTLKWILSRAFMLDDKYVNECRLKQIYCAATVPPITLLYWGTEANANQFIGLPDDIPVYVPKGCAEAYRTATTWERFTNYVEIEDDQFPSYTGIRSAAASDDAVKAYSDNGELVIENPTAPLPYSVISIAGNAEANGMVSGELRFRLNHGIHIVRIGSQSFKIAL